MNRFNQRIRVTVTAIIFYLCFHTLQAQPFVLQTGVIVQPNIWHFKWGDYDNDGDGDYLVYNWSERNTNGTVKWIIKIFNNNGNNVFTEKATILSSLDQITPSWADIDNDGDLDILLSGGHMNLYAEIYQNNGNNSFSKLPGITMSALYWGASAWADYDNDGYLDVIITGHTDTGVTKLYHNNGNSTFTEQAGNSFIGVCFSSSVDWGDYDNDGDLDILLAGNTGFSGNDSAVTRIYRNNGSGIFTEQTNISLLGVGKGISSFGDYNNDGFLDILLAGKGYCKIYKNTGNGNFIEQTDITLPGLNSGSASWGDYDNDGDLDILITGSASNGLTTTPVTKIYSNNGNGGYSELTNIQILTINGESNWVDYDSDGDLDILIYGTYLSNGKQSDTTLLYRNDLVKTTISNCFVSGNQAIKIYPNPTDGFCNVITADKNRIEAIEICTISGSLIYKAPINIAENNFKIDLTGKTKGIYILKINTGIGIVYHKLLLE